MDLGTGPLDGGFFAGPQPWRHSFHISLVASNLDIGRHRADPEKQD